MGKEFIGGQAVVEGVLMMKNRHYAVAVQGPKKVEIKTGEFPLKRDFWMQFPILRGIVLMFTTLFVGFKAMAWGTSVAEEEEFTSGMLFWAILLSLGLALILFKILPLFITGVLVSTQDTFLFNVLDGVLRICILLIYLYLIGRTDDVKRLFRYHAAEHKVINAYEAVGKITLAQSRKASRFHVRCSTSFMVLVLVVAVLVFSLVPLDMPFWQLVLVRLSLVLPIAGISWEIIRFIGIHADSVIMKPLIIPGFWVQRLTTIEPGDAEIKVAMKALRAVLKQA